MRDYIHAFCNLDVGRAGVTEYQKATKLIVARFRTAFQNLSETQVKIGEEVKDSDVD